MEPFEDGGVVYELKLSSKTSTGYQCVVEERPGEFQAKATLVKGGGQVTLPGGACKTAREAALRLAKQKASQQQVMVKKRAATSGKVRARRVPL